MTDPGELLAAPEWDFGDGVSLPIPPGPLPQLAARWADRLVDLTYTYPDHPELVAVMLAGILQLERQRVLSEVERTIVKEF